MHYLKHLRNVIATAAAAFDFSCALDRATTEIHASPLLERVACVRRQQPRSVCRVRRAEQARAFSVGTLPLSLSLAPLPFRLALSSNQAATAPLFPRAGPPPFICPPFKLYERVTGD